MKNNIHKPMIDKLTHEIKCYFDTLSETYYHQGREDGIEEGAKSVESWDKACYEQGLSDAWECARKIVFMRAGKKKTIFDDDSSMRIFDSILPSEAIAKIKEYEEKQDDEIEVGDEVYILDPHHPFVVTRITESGYIVGISQAGKYVDVSKPETLHKTGRHFDQIEEVLKQMQEDKG